MAVTLVKQKAALKEPTQHLDVVDVTKLDMDDLADRYGSLEDKIAALMHNPIFAQFEEVKKELAARLEVYEPTDELAIKGHHWVLEVGVAKKNPRKLKEDAVMKVMEFVGTEAFSKIAKVTLADVEKYCTPDQAEVVIESDTGYSKNRAIKASFLG